MIIAFSIIIAIAAVALVALVLMQSGKSHGLSGSIAGGAETFFGKENGKKADKILGRVTTVLAVAFCVVLIVLYLVQPDLENVQTPDLGLGNSQYFDATTDTSETTTADTTPETTVDTAADSAADTTADTAADTTADTTADTAADTAADTTADTAAVTVG